MPIALPFLLKGLLLIFITCILPVSEIRGQAILNNNTEIPAPAFDEVPILVIVQGYTNFYVNAIYTSNDLLCVNVEDFFKTLNIPCTVGQEGNSLSGFIENENQTYLIDFNSGQIKIGSKVIYAKNGLIKEMGTLFMETSLFAEAFGLTLTFNFRSLTIILKSNFELPYIKQMRIDQMRNNMSKVKGELIADTIVNRNYHLLKFGTLDWSTVASQSWNGSTYNQFGLGIGTEFLYGEADISVNYNNRQKFDNRQLHYLWRWVDNDKSIIKQAQVGKISNQTISFINAPVIGAVIRNSPTTVRKAKGYYTVNEFTEPNWNVELYINNVMVDYTTADASGLYTFKVPIVYGYTTLKLKFYGTLGEERMEERTMNVPYTVMPAGEFEYSLSGGILQDTLSSRFGKGEFNYGVNRFLTIGGGMEYLSSISNGNYIPYLTATIQPFSKLTFYGTYAHGIKARGIVNYYLKKDVLLEVDYTKFVEGQLATLFNAPEERNVKLSIPFRVKKLSGFSRFDFTQFVYKAYNYNQAIVMFSSYYNQISANSSTQLNWITNRIPNITSDITVSYRLAHGFTIRPSTQYSFSASRFITHKLAVEKYIPNGNLSISYQRNVFYKENTFSINFKYDLPFARTNIAVSRTGKNMTTSESLQGSLAFGGGNNYIHKSNNPSMSKGGIALYPFLDLNQNGIFDKGERMVKLTSVRVMGGRVIISEKDSIIRIPDLNPFTNYLIEFQDKDLDNISWRFKKKIYQVLIDPNQFKHIDIPIISVGEVSGMAYMNTNNSLKGIARILVKFYDKNTKKEIAKTLSESDGYIYYLGLNPGDYIARIDSEQLENLKMISSPEQIPITISQSFDGDIIGGFDFTLSLTEKLVTDTKNTHIQVEPALVDSDNQAITETQAPEPNNAKTSNYYLGYMLPIGDLKTKVNALNAQIELMKYTDKPVSIMYKNGIYKVWISGLSGIEEYNALIANLEQTKIYNDYLLNQENVSNNENKTFNNTHNAVIQTGAANNHKKLIFNNTYSAVIQVGAFIDQRNAIRAEKRLIKIIDHPITVIFEDGFYKVRINGFTGRNQASEFIPKLTNIGFTEVYIVRIKQP